MVTGSLLLVGRATLPYQERVCTLLFTDLVGSTRLTQTLGRHRASEIFSRDDRLTADLVEEHEGLTIDKSDGLLILFDRPWSAVCFGLAYHRALAALEAELRAELAPHHLHLETRIGIHVGDVVLRESPHKALEVEGVAKPIAGRIMSLAGARQILLTRFAFDPARDGADGTVEARDLKWISHGHYALRGLAEPVEVLEVGIPGFSPLSPPARCDKAWPVDGTADLTVVGQVPDSIELRSRFSGLYLESLWDDANPHSRMNRALLDQIRQSRRPYTWNLSEKAFAVAADSLLRDLIAATREKGRAARLVSTTTMTESVGITAWFEARPLRQMVARTRDVISTSSARCDCWRILMLKDPNAVRKPGRLPAFYAMLEENRNIGLSVAVFPVDAVPSSFSYESSDFYCVPERRVMITAPPYYFLAEFTSARSFDKDVVRAYSDLSSHLIESARSGIAGSFEWLGGTLTDLEEALKALAK